MQFERDGCHFNWHKILGLKNKMKVQAEANRNNSSATLPKTIKQSLGHCETQYTA